MTTLTVPPDYQLPFYFEWLQLGLAAEVVDQLVRVEKYLMLLGYDDHYPEITADVTVDHASMVERGQAARATYLTHVNRVLVVCGIELIDRDDIPLVISVNLLKAIATIGTESISDLGEVTGESIDEPILLLSQVVAHLTDTDAMDYVPYIDSVAERVTEHITKILGRSSPELASLARPEPSIIHRFKEAILAINYDSSYVIDMVRITNRLGYNLDVYGPPIMGQLEQADLDTATLASELMLMVLASSVPDVDVKEAFHRIVDEYSDSDDVLTIKLHSYGHLFAESV